MKMMKRLSAILIAVLLMVSMMVVPASAAGTGSITITNTATPVSYNLYKILTLESYDATAGTYSYTLNGDTWDDFIKTGTGSTYLAVTEDTNYVVARATFTHDTHAALLANAAVAYANEKSIAPTKTGSVTEANTTITFSDLPHGYYVIESSRGTALIANTVTATTLNIAEKNNLPAIVKQVQENSTNAWGVANDADVGETVNYKITVTAANDAKNYIIHDTMADGLTYNSSSLKVVFFDHSATTNQETEMTLNSDYTISSASDGCIFELVIDQDFITSKGVSVNDKFIISYSATLDADSGRGTTPTTNAVNTNKNSAVLKFGGETDSTGKIIADTQEVRYCNDTVTYTYNMTITKTKSGGGVLPNAQFVVKKGAGDATKYLKVADTGFLSWVTTKADGTTFTSGTDGTFSISGLDAGTYYLEETVAPSGYNKLSGDITFILTADHTTQGLTLELSGSGATNPNRDYKTGEASFVVENVFGSILPSTGGIGTTIFYAVGGVLVIGALSLLIVRKRTTAK